MLAAERGREKMPGGTRCCARVLLPLSRRAERTMGMPVPPVPDVHRRWTADEVRSLIDPDRAWPRHELIDGELLDEQLAWHPDGATDPFELYLAAFFERVDADES